MTFFLVLEVRILLIVLFAIFWMLWVGKKLKTYISEDTVEKGNDDLEISPKCLKAIQESKVSLIIFSKNYASSLRCLEELDQILKCKEEDKVVVPVFYHVIPSHVRWQKGSYGDAFVAHEERFKDQKEKVQQWRNSLTTVADLAGFHSSNYR